MAKKAGDLNMISSAQKEKLLAFSKLEVARADLAISKNNAEQKRLEFLKDQNLIKSNFNETSRGNILRKYDVDLKRLKLSNKKIKTKLGASINKNTLKKDEEMLLEEISEAEAELKKARSEGDLNKINQALKKRTLAKSKLQITRAEISIAQNKEKSKMLEYDRDFKLSYPSLSLEERRNIHGNYSISVNQLNSEYNNLKNNIRNSINDRKLKQKKIEYDTALNQLNKAMDLGNPEDINAARKLLETIDTAFETTKKEIEQIENSQKIDQIKFQKESLTEKINDLNKQIAESKKASIEKNRNVFIKSGQVFSNEYAKVFNGPSPKEKEALLIV